MRDDEEKAVEREIWQSKIISSKSLVCILFYNEFNFSLNLLKSKSMTTVGQTWLMYVCEHHCSVWVEAWREGSLCEQHVGGEAMSQSLCFIIQRLPHLTAKSKYILEVDWGLCTSLVSLHDSKLLQYLSQVWCVQQCGIWLCFLNLKAVYFVDSHFDSDRFLCRLVQLEADRVIQGSNGCPNLRGVLDCVFDSVTELTLSHKSEDRF